MVMPNNIDVPENLQNTEPIKYKLMLHSPNGLPINPILGVFDLISEFKLDTVSNLTFSVSKNINIHNKMVENPLWDYLDMPFLVSLNDEKTYRIQEAPLNVDEDGGVSKKITAFSLENEMTSKLIRNFKSTINDISKPAKLYDLVSDVLKEHFDNNWTLSESDIDPDLRGKYRLIPDTDEKNVFEFFREIQSSFNCLFKYDSSIDPETKQPRRKIIVYDATIYRECPKCKEKTLYYHNGEVYCKNYEDTENPKCTWKKAIYGQDSGLVITDKNYIKTYTEKFSAPITRLYVKGADDLDIILANPTGQEYIENFDYYRNEKYMSSALREALDRYDVLLNSLADEIEKKQGLLNNATIEKTKLLYGSKDGIAEEIAMVESWIDRADDYFDDWAVLFETDTTDMTSTEIDDLNDEMQSILDNANSCLKNVDLWFQGIEVSSTIKGRTDWIEYGIENLRRLYNIYEERISVIAKLNDKLESSFYNLEGYTEDIAYSVFTKRDGELAIDTRYEGIKVEKLTAICNKIEEQLNKLENNELVAAENNITLYQGELDELREKMSKQNAVYEDDNGVEQKIFTDELIKELNVFILEGTYTNDTIGTSAVIGSSDYLKQCAELYNDGVIALNEKHQPIVSIETDVVDFLGSCDCVLDKANFGLGNIIRVHHSESYDKANDYANMIFRIVAYKYAPSVNKLSITFSNTEKFVAGGTEMARLLKNSSSTSSVVSISKGSWNRAEQNAVDTIINDGLNTAKTTIQCADNQRSLIDNRGITMGSYVDSESDKQVRLMNTGLYITVDNWGTIKSAVTADGVIADRLIGRQLIGNTLMLDASSDDGNTVFARFDSKGFRIANGSLSVGNVDGETGDVDFDGQGFFVDPNRGVIVRSDGTNPCEIRLNPNSGYRCSTCGHVQDATGACQTIIDAETNTKCSGTVSTSDLVKAIEIVTVDSQGETITNHMYFDRSNNKFLVNGSILAKSLYLTELGSEDNNIIEYIDEKIEDAEGKYSTNGNGAHRDKKNKIKGDYIEGRGLKAYDSSGDIRVEIDGRDGGIRINDGYIRMSEDGYIYLEHNTGEVVEDTSTGNKYTLYNSIKIDPKSGIYFKKDISKDEDGDEETLEDITETVMKLNINDGSATFSGDIDTKKSILLNCNRYSFNQETGVSKYDDVGIKFCAEGKSSEQGYIDFTMGTTNEPSLNIYSKAGIRLSNNSNSYIHLHGEGIDMHAQEGISGSLTFNNDIYIKNGESNINVKDNIKNLITDVDELKRQVAILMAG